MNDRRAKHRIGLHESYLLYYDALCAKLPSHWQPISGFRTFEDQKKLYALGRTIPGKIVTRADAGLSYHQYGAASDWDYFKDGYYCPLEFKDPLWEEYQNICKEVGLRVLNFEKPHNELPLEVKTSKLLDAFNKEGIRAVDWLIRNDAGILSSESH